MSLHVGVQVTARRCTTSAGVKGVHAVGSQLGEGKRVLRTPHAMSCGLGATCTGLRGLNSPPAPAESLHYWQVPWTIPMRTEWMLSKGTTKRGALGSGQPRPMRLPGSKDQPQICLPNPQQSSQTGHGTPPKYWGRVGS